MGQLRQVHCPVGVKPLITLRGKMLPPLLFGFTVSATIVFAAVSSLASIVSDHAPTAVALIVALLLSLAAVADVVFPRLRVSLMRRQTPGALSAHAPAPITGLVWGLDTGSVFSTYRGSAASWSALLLTAVGWGPWWTGLAYAVGFSVPIAVLTWTYSVVGRTSEALSFRHRSTQLLVADLTRPLVMLRYASASAAAFAAVILIIRVP